MAGGYKVGSDFQMERRKWQEKWQAQCAELEAIPPKGRGGGKSGSHQQNRKEPRIIINHNDINNYVNIC